MNKFVLGFLDNCKTNLVLTLGLLACIICFSYLTGCRIIETGTLEGLLIFGFLPFAFILIFIALCEPIEKVIE